MCKSFQRKGNVAELFYGVPKECPYTWHFDGSLLVYYLSLTTNRQQRNKQRTTHPAGGADQIAMLQKFLFAQGEGEEEKRSHFLLPQNKASYSKVNMLYLHWWIQRIWQLGRRNKYVQDQDAPPQQP